MYNAKRRLEEKERYAREQRKLCQQEARPVTFRNIKSAKGHVCVVERRGKIQQFQEAANENVVPVSFLAYREGKRDGLKRFLDENKKVFPTPRNILDRHCGL